MSQVVLLARAFLFEHPVRLLLTTAATAAATCLVVWIVSSYDALQRTYDEYAELALGRYDLAIAPIDLDGKHVIAPQLVSDLRADARLALVDPMWAQKLVVDSQLGMFAANEIQMPNATSSTSLTLPPAPEAGPVLSPASDVNPAGSNVDRMRPAWRPELLVLGIDAPEPPHPMQAGVWLTEAAQAPLSAQAARPEVVLRQDVAKSMHLTVGDVLPVRSAGGTYRLKIVGLVNGPSVPVAGPGGPQTLTPSSAEAFITMGLAEELFAASRKVSLIGVALREPDDLTQFRFGWAPKLSRYKTPVQFQEAFEIEEALDQEAAAQNVRLQSFAATGVAMLVAALVIHSSLSVGVNERSRQYAVLRAIGFSPGRVAGLIVIEGLVLGLSGFVVGLAASWLLLSITGQVAARILYHGVHIGYWSLALAALAMMGGALAASVVPACRAMRVKPIDAMAPRPAGVEDPRFVGLSLVAGLVLVAINPMLAFVFSPTSERGVYFAMGIGVVTIVGGFALLAPLIVRTVDSLASPILARLLAVDPKLIASQLSARLWRSVAAAVSLALGLGLFFCIHVWGWTMLEAFIPGDWAPDAMAVFSPGISEEQVVALNGISGIHENHCTKMVVEQPRLLQDLTGSAERASITRQDNIILVGLDPKVALGGADPMLSVEWVAGDPAGAIQSLQAGRACVVPDHFLRESGLRLHDWIAVVPPEHPDQPVQYEIVGAVNLHGWHWQTKLTGLRPRTHRAAALALAGYDSVARDFNQPLATHLWFDYDPAETPDTAQLTEALTKALTQAEGQSRDVGAMQVHVMPVEDIRSHLRNIARRWLWVISQVPLLALVIAAVGVLNVLLASVRARRWEFGVMRAIGIGPAELSRAILAEGVLIAVVASVLSVSFGILAGWCGCGLAQYISFFGGLHPPLVIPLVPILAGVGFALLLGLLCAAIPALVIGRSRPLDLLQQTVDSL